LLHAGLRGAAAGFSGSVRGTPAGQTDHSTGSHRAVLKDEADALLDYRRGLRAYHRDDTWRAAVVEHFKENVRGMIALAENAGVPIFVVLPPSNLGDCPPFKSQHHDRLDESARSEWRRLLEKARSLYRSDLQGSIRWLKKAIRLDPRFAASYYELGKAYEALGLYEQAREAFLEAREQDVCPLRILQPMERILADAAAEAGVPFVDAHALLERECPGGILGDYLLVDHVHPSIPGHQRIADRLAEEMVAEGWVKPDDDWEAKRTAAYERHYQSLPDFYFLKGKRHLEALQAWTQGRADGPPIESRVKLDGE
jgi:tetratricopeptide (TPR) repeat protein